jgi:hypothetical protein
MAHAAAQTTESETRKHIRALVKRLGAQPTARKLNLPRSSVLALAADAPVREGTLTLAAQRLREAGVR